MSEEVQVTWSGDVHREPYRGLINASPEKRSSPEIEKVCLKRPPPTHRRQGETRMRQCEPAMLRALDRAGTTGLTVDHLMEATGAPRTYVHELLSQFRGLGLVENEKRPHQGWKQRLYRRWTWITPLGRDYLRQLERER